jgi:hypothetical protein
MGSAKAPTSRGLPAKHLDATHLKATHLEVRHLEASRTLRVVDVDHYPGGILEQKHPERLLR